MMKKKIIKFRGFEITKRELIIDLVFLLVAFLISLLLIFVFDIHWSFYPGETLIPPSKYVGIGKDIYLIGSLIGSIIGFFIIKLFLLGIKEHMKNE